MTVSVRDLINKIDNDSIVIQENKIKTAVQHGGETLVGIIIITAEYVYLKIEPIVYDGKSAYYKLPKDEPSGWAPNGTNELKDGKYIENFPLLDTPFKIICK